jgi:glycosyltransferase involved in cell wall biosynthesis
LKQVQARAVFWSASFDLTTGQALVTARVAKSNYGIKWSMAVYPPGVKGVLGFARATLILCNAILFGRCRVVYLVCSRSVLGFMRDIPALLPALFNIRVVVHVHGSDVSDLLSRRLIGVVAKFLYRRCEIIVPSLHLHKPLNERGCTNVYVIENFARMTFPTRPRNARETFQLLWNSNIMASKGIREFVEGALIARAAGVPLSLVVLGRPIADGEASRAEMEAYSETLLGLDWINVRGPVSPEMAERALIEADLVALPSRYPTECQPLAIVQAMCAGCKVIVADTPALRATMGSYNAWFVKPTADAISKAIVEAATTPNIDHGMKVAAMARFNPSLFDERMTAILKESLKNFP